MRGHHPGRRHALAALGVGAAFLPSLWGRRAQAASPQRLIIMISQHQVMPEAFVMRGSAPARTSFTRDLGPLPLSEWSKVLSPLAPHRDRLTVIEGLSQLTGLHPTVEVNGHNASYLNLLTAAGIDPMREKFALGPSVDQVIARAIAPVGKLPSLELGYQPPTGGWINQAADQRLPTIGSPAEALARLFPGIARPPDTDRRRKLRAARSSVVDFSRAEYERVAPRLSGADRQKLDHHVQLLRDLEARLQAAGSLAACAAPKGEYPDYVGPTMERFALWARLTAAALACDLTRVVTLQVNELRNYEFSAPDGSLHQDFSHHSHLNEAAATHMGNYNAGYGKLLASLLDELASYRDGNGSLLDNCLVVWMPEHGLTREPHLVIEQAVVIAGGAAVGWPAGRYISVPRTTPHPMFGREQLVGTPHSHFLVSLLRAMGVNRGHFGLPEVRTAGGQVVSLQGPLAELT